MNNQKKIECTAKTLRKLLKNKKELLNAESIILQTLAIDHMEGIETESYVTEKIFEISNLIMHLTDNIKECQKKLRK
jgi:hypothetical protein